ncbi:MAG: GerMN domain-containing protein [Deltaproteobacteria bacterium]|nr:GerMN domain-containing protein [Deltaproteobacteria bacterium]
MATKKKRRNNELKSKRQKKTLKTVILIFIVLCIVGFLVFFFVTLFDLIFPPQSEKEVTVRSRAKIAVILYFSDDNERFLVPEKRFIPKENNLEGQAREIIKALIDGSKTKHINTFPDNIELQSVTIDADKTARVSFSKKLIQKHPGSSASEMATIYSLTNSLTVNLPDIEKVRILVDEKALTTIKGHINTKQSFRRSEEMIAPRS